MNLTDDERAVDSILSCSLPSQQFTPGAVLTMLKWPNDDGGRVRLRHVLDSLRDKGKPYTERVTVA